MSIPFLDLGAAYRELKTEIDHAVARVVASGWYVLGEEVEAFESEFAAYTESAHCVGVASGLDALYLALRAIASSKATRSSSHRTLSLRPGLPSAAAVRCPLQLSRRRGRVTSTLHV